MIKLDVVEQNKTLHLKAGDALVELVNTCHFGEKNRAEPAEIIVFYAGTEEIPVTIQGNYRYNECNTVWKESEAK